MSERGRNIIVGLFVLAGLAVLALLIEKFQSTAGLLTGRGDYYIDIQADQTEWTGGNVAACGSQAVGDGCPIPFRMPAQQAAGRGGGLTRTGDASATSNPSPTSIAGPGGQRNGTGHPPVDPPAARPLAARSYFNNGGGVPWSIPDGLEVDWAGEGEWNITIDVMRDLGLAFAAACLGIYVLLVYETKSYLMPLILMISIPLTIIGIMPGFWLLNALTADPVGHSPIARHSFINTRQGHRS